MKWAGHDRNHNTYEPIAHLAGCEDMIAEYNERKRQREQELVSKSLSARACLQLWRQEGTTLFSL